MRVLEHSRIFQKMLKTIWIFSEEFIQYTLYKHDCTNRTLKLLFYMAKLVSYDW